MADEDKMTSGPTISEKQPSVIDATMSEENFNKVPLGEGIPPGDHDTVVDPRLKDYPIPLVAKTVSLENDPTEPILTFRFWFLSIFWIVIGCAISTMYYFKPNSLQFGAYAVQILSWGTGYAMAKYLPTRQFNIFRWTFSLNPGPFNQKEHALLVVAYWGSCATAYGLGPLSALELFYGKKFNSGWAIIFLITTQMIGYGFCGLYRDVLVRPPKMYYPGELPNVAVFNAMHKDPAATKKSLRFFGIVALCAFVYEWIPSLFMPLLSSLPLVCYFAPGSWKAFALGSGNLNTGFGMLDLSLDWNYISFLQPLYTPLWANVNMIAGVLFTSWFLYPIIYFSNSMDALTFSPMSTRTWDKNGNKFKISKVITPEFTLNQTALDSYSQPFWSPSYTFYFFFAFAATAASVFYAVLWYGKESWVALKDAYQGRREDYNDPYLKLMSFDPRVPHWWYLVLLALCAALSLATVYQSDTGLPWWGFIIVSLISFVFTWPNGILFARANLQIGMSFLSELISGGFFPGKPMAVLTSMAYSTQILEQNLNLISDYKFGFYMKIPEREMFIGQIWGTLLGPFVNYGVMRLLLDHEAPAIRGDVTSTRWAGVSTINMYSSSIIWGLIGPRKIFSKDSIYSWVYYGFLVGAGATAVVWAVSRRLKGRDLEQIFNPSVFFAGMLMFPKHPMSNFMTSALVAVFFMGYMYRYHPVWFRKYNYLLGVGLDCGTQLMTVVMMFAVDIPNLQFPAWWGHNSDAPDRCFAPTNGPKALAAS